MGRRDTPRTARAGTLPASMWPRLSILAGLLTGVAAAALIIGGIIAFAPTPGAAATPPPSRRSPSGRCRPTPRRRQPRPVSAGSASPDASASGGEGLFHVGEPAPALVVPQVGGGIIDLAKLRGSPVWVNFMGTYCPPCVDEIPIMTRFSNRHADDGLVVIAVDVKEDEGVVAAFAEQLGATFPLGLDSDGSAATRWDAVALPVHFWIDKDGVVRDGALGGIGPDIMARGAADDPAGRRRPTVTAAGASAPAGRRSPGPEDASSGPQVSSRADIAVALAALVSARPPLLIVADFDGTLAAGSRDPAVARIEPLAQRGLRRLARIAASRPGRAPRGGPHGPGRGRRRRARAGRWHGVPRRPRPPARPLAARRACRTPDRRDRPGLRRPSRPRRDARRRGRRRARSSGVAVRRAQGSVGRVPRPTGGRCDRRPFGRRRRHRDRGAARSAWSTGWPTIAAGRSSTCVRATPAASARRSRGSWIGTGPGAVVALGDEMSDIDAFEGVVDARAAGRVDAGITVAVHGTTRPAPPELLAVADLRLAGAHDGRPAAGGAGAPPGGSLGLAADRQGRDGGGRPLDDLQQRRRDEPEAGSSGPSRGQPAPQQRPVARAAARRWPGRA